MSNAFKAHLMVLLATFLVAGSFIISKKLSGVIHPISLNLLRFLIASCALAPFIFTSAKKRSRILPSLLENADHQPFLRTLFHRIF